MTHTHTHTRKGRIVGVVGRIPVVTRMKHAHTRTHTHTHAHALDAGGGSGWRTAPVHLNEHSCHIGTPQPTEFITQKKGPTRPHLKVAGELRAFVKQVAEPSPVHPLVSVGGRSVLHRESERGGLSVHTQRP